MRFKSDFPRFADISHNFLPVRRNIDQRIGNAVGINLSLSRRIKLVTQFKHGIGGTGQQHESAARGKELAVALVAAGNQHIGMTDIIQISR